MTAAKKQRPVWYGLKSYVCENAGETLLVTATRKPIVTAIVKAHQRTGGSRIRAKGRIKSVSNDSSVYMPDYYDMSGLVI